MKAIALGVKILGLLILGIAATAGQQAQNQGNDQKNTCVLFKDISGLVAKQVIAVQLDGSIIVVGTAYNTRTEKYELVLARYMANGTLDNHFGSGGITVTALPCGAIAKAVGVQATGNIIVAADYKQDALCQDIVLVCYKPNGVLDKSFGNGLGYVFADMRPICDVNALVVCPDDKLIIGGWYCDGEQPLGGILLMRFLANGAPDIAFGIDGCIKNHVCDRAASICALKTIKPGCVLAAGVVLKDDFEQMMIMKWRTNGRVDCLFGGGAGYVLLPMVAKMSKGAATLTILDEKILVAGNHFDAAHGRHVIILNRILPDGTLDSSFGERGMVLVAPGDGDACVHALDLQKDGSIILAGSMVNGGVLQTILVRLNDQGVLETSFGEKGMVRTAFTGNAASGIVITDKAAWITGKEAQSTILAKYTW